MEISFKLPSLRKQTGIISLALIILWILAAVDSAKVVFDYAYVQREANNRTIYSSIEESLDRKILSIKTLMNALSCQNDLQQVLINKQLYKTSDGWSNLLSLMFKYSTLESGIASVVTSDMDGKINWYYYFHDRDMYNKQLNSALDNLGISGTFLIDNRNMFTISREINKYTAAQFSGRQSQSERIGTCVFFIDLDEIMDTLNIDKISAGHTYAIFDNDGKLFWREKEFDDKLINATHNLVNNTAETGSNMNINIDGIAYTAYMSRSSVTGLTLIGVSDGAMLSDSMVDMATRMMLTWIIVIILTFTLIVFLYRNISRFIQFLQTSMENCRDAGGRLHMKYFSKREFSVVADTFNEMIDRMEQLTKEKMDIQEKLYLEELDRRDVSLMALQSQVNPHFLYNTLECIKSIGVCYGVDEIRVICESLARLMRYSINEKNLSTVDEELTCVANYISIQNVRFDGRFSIDMLVDDNCRPLLMLRMLLQPLIENAFIHGFGKRPGSGKVKIFAHIYGADRFQITIEDDGIGMTDEELKSLYEHMRAPIDVHTGSVGLRNVYQRLKLYYNERAQIDIDSKEGVGTCIMLTIPRLEE